MHVAVGIDDQNDGDRGQKRDRRQVPLQIEGGIWIDDLVDDDGQRCKEQRVAILAGMGDIFSGDTGSRARLVLDYDLLADNRSKAVGEHAPGDVGGRSRRESDNDVNWTRRINIARQGKAWSKQRGKAEQRHRPTVDLRHCSLPVSVLAAYFVLFIASFTRRD